METRYSNVYVVNSFDVRWGHVSQIKAEIELFEKSSLKQYSYYHLISGMDLPLHNQDYIHKFFETNQGYEFIGFGNKNWDVRNRVHCHNFCVSFLRSNNMFIRYTARFLRKMFNRLQVLFHVHINSLNHIYRYGCNWCSVTHDFVTDLLKGKKEIFQTYKYSFCPDEIYKQTFAINSKYRNKIFDYNNEFKSCMREIDWNRGRPYIWQTDDFYALISSKKLFARKFDERVDSVIIDKIVNRIMFERQA